MAGYVYQIYIFSSVTPGLSKSQFTRHSGSPEGLGTQVPAPTIRNLALQDEFRKLRKDMYFRNPSPPIGYGFSRISRVRGEP